MRRGFGAAVAALGVLMLTTPAAHAAAQAPAAPDVREISPKKLPLRGDLRAAAKPSAPAMRAAAAGETPPVGTVKTWLALDDEQGFYYFKDYTLRAVGDHIEVWVANDMGFQDGDCRNGPRTTITDEQVQYLVGQFDDNIYPKESVAFSTPPGRDGSASQDEILGPPEPGYWGGEGDNIVTLVDNVRDANYYDLNNTNNFSYIAGFFSSQLSELFDRNVMTIDAFDWLHRTGASPPNEPVPGDNCANANARPFLYEGVFAHEYQHLLEDYEDVDEYSWINEGLADWAQTLTGYVDPSRRIDEPGFDSHVQCFLGWLGVSTPFNPLPRAGGPENSLTLWGDQGDDEILCDYGAAYTMMEMLAGRYGTSFMTALHRGDENGFAGVDDALRTVGARGTAQSILRDWAAMVALDGVLDRGARLRERSLRTPTLDASINWDEPNAYDTPGAPPNGSDYVRLRDRSGRFLSARELRWLSFDGAETLEPKSLEWTVDLNPPDHPGNPALFSGAGPDFDRAMIREVTVPAANPILTFRTRWNTEELWDFGFVQISTDGGATYRSIGNAETTSEHDPAAIPMVAANVPGFTGDSGGWRSETFDLSAYAGQSVLLAFRYVTDPLVDGAGWWIDDVAVGGTPVSDGSSLDGWQTPTQMRPVPVEGYTVQLVGYNSRRLEDPTLAGASARGRHDRRHHSRKDVAFAYNLRVDRDNQVVLGPWRLRKLLARSPRADVVSVLIMQNDASELVHQYARYTLKANEVTQPGG